MYFTYFDCFPFKPRNKSFIKNCRRDEEYDGLLSYAKEHFKIVGSDSYIGNYNGENLKNSFVDLEQYALQRKDKKKALQLYLHYPHSYAKLRLKLWAAPPEISDDEDFDIFPSLPSSNKKVMFPLYFMLTILCFDVSQLVKSVSEKKRNQLLIIHAKNNNTDILKKFQLMFM